MNLLKKLFYIRGQLNRELLFNNSSFNVPVKFNGKGKVSLGKNISFGYSLAPKVGNGSILIQARYKESKITIGDFVEFSNSVSIISLKSVSIGNMCLIADSVLIVDSDFHDIPPVARKSPLQRLSSDGKISPTVIQNNVWIGSHSLVLKGVKIGSGSIIGAGSVVTKNIPSDVLACGVPAKIVRYLS